MHSPHYLVTETTQGELPAAMGPAVEIVGESEAFSFFHNLVLDHWEYADTFGYPHHIRPERPREPGQRHITSWLVDLESPRPRHAIVQIHELPFGEVV